MATRKLPPAYVRFARAYPRLLKAYEALGDTLLADGPLDRRTAALVKVGIAVGARLEGGVHAHTRRALEAGVSADAIRHAVRLALTTIGFPSMMSALTWTEDVLATAGASRRISGSAAARRRHG
jgi:4-carboxymuconolactone decarboxylase